jgi:hypothetical protein
MFMIIPASRADDANRPVLAAAGVKLFLFIQV